MEGDAEQALLVEVGFEMDEFRFYVEERLRAQPSPRVDDPHLAGLLDERLAATAVRNGHHVERCVDARHIGLEANFDFGLRGVGCTDGKCHGRGHSQACRGCAHRLNVLPDTFFALSARSAVEGLMSLIAKRPVLSMPAAKSGVRVNGGSIG